MKKTKSHIKLFITVLLLLLCNKGKTSPQSPDLIIYQGDTMVIYTLILEQYFEIIGQEAEEGQLFGLNFRDGASLNCWRGYQAIYLIKNDSLFLEHITSCNEIRYSKTIDSLGSKKRIQEIFGDKMKDGRVFLDWYSGKFTLPNGNMLRWDGVFYASFEKELLIEFKNGVIKKTSEIENYTDEPDKINRRYSDTLSKFFLEEIKKINWANDRNFDCSEEYLLTIGKKGTITGIVMFHYQTKEDIKIFWDRFEYNFCIKKLKRGLKKMKFDILKRSGQAIEEKVYFDIWIHEDGTIDIWPNSK